MTGGFVDLSPFGFDPSEANVRFVRAVSVTLLTKALGICFGVLTSVIVARYLGP
jgi:hypothetical protein